MNREETLWLSTGLDFLADDVAACCGLDSDDPCETCGHRIAGLTALERSGDYVASH